MTKINKSLLFTVLLLFFSLLLAGCVKIDVYQKIKRSGNMDINLSFQSDSALILDGIKKGLEIDSSVKDKFIYEETSDSATYKFTNINPAKDLMFKVKNQNDASQFLFDKNKYKLNIEFKFPYYYYTYEIDMRADDSKVGDESFATQSLNALVNIGYTVECFGKIIETNGNKMSNNKVKFTIGLNDDKIYQVKFRDFFLSSWLGLIFK